MTSTAKPAKPAKPATPVTPPNRFAATLRSYVAADWGATLERAARLTAYPIALTLTSRDAARHYAASLLGRLNDFATRLGY
jgi:hypothetical protein